MLRTANLLSLSPGITTVNHTSSEQTNTESSSFAQSFDEGAETAWKMQTMGDKELNITIGADNHLLTKNSNNSAALADVNGKARSRTDEKAQGGLFSPKNPNLTTNSEPTNSFGEITRDSRRGIPPLIGDSSGAQLEVTSKDLSGVQGYSGKIKDFSRQNTLNSIDSDSLNITGEAKESDAIVPSVGNYLPTANGYISTEIGKKKNGAVSNEPQDSIRHRKEKKVQDKPGATSQNVKLKNKASDKSDESIVATINPAIGVPVMLHTVNGLQHDMRIVTNDDQGLGDTSNVIDTSGRAVMSSNNQPNDKTSAIKKQNEENAKVLGDPNNVTNSQALVAGAEKTALNPAQSFEASNAKGKNEIMPVGTMPAGSIASGIIVDHNSGNAAIYANTKSQEVERSSNTASAHIPINASDVDGSTDKMHKTLLATPTTLEVGVINGTHGWLKVRAEMTGEGLVNTSLSASSSSAEEMLHRELPSLSAFLQHEHVAVNTVVIQPAIVPAANLREMAGGMGEESRGQAQHEQAQGGEDQHGSASDTVYGAQISNSSSIESGIRGDELPLPRLLRRCRRLAKHTGLINYVYLRSTADYIPINKSREHKMMGSQVDSMANSAAATVASALAPQKKTQVTAKAASAPDSTSSSDSTSTSATDGATITSSDFLTLLVSELKNQDPTQPTDPNAYIQQLVGVNSLQQLISINQDLTPTSTSTSTPTTGS